MNNEIIKKTFTFLGNDGLNFFNDCKLKYGTVSPIIVKRNYPHSVHFNEGMQIRNFLRSLEECKFWDDHDFDDNWIGIIEKCLEYNV